MSSSIICLYMFVMMNTVGNKLSVDLFVHSSNKNDREIVGTWHLIELISNSCKTMLWQFPIYDRGRNSMCTYGTCDHVQFVSIANFTIVTDCRLLHGRTKTMFNIKIGIFANCYFMINTHRVKY